jgi:hypothetical protein
VDEHEFIDALYSLMISQSIGAFYIEREIVNDIKKYGYNYGKMDFVNTARDIALKTLTKYNINITIEEK